MSGYIDLGHRLAADDAGMAAVFAGEARLLPQPTDLSCFNWATNRLDSCSSRCFEVREGTGGEGAVIIDGCCLIQGRGQPAKIWRPSRTTGGARSPGWPVL